MLLKNIRFMALVFGLLFSLSANAASILDSLFHSPSDPIAGNPNGKVTIVEFFDYQCSHCINMVTIIQSVIRTNPDVRIVFKEYPIRGPVSELASRAALAANLQGKYYTFNHALLLMNGDISESAIFNLARSNGLNVSKLKKDMASKSISDKIQANYKLARELGIEGTPAFFIGKTNAQDTEQVNFVLGEMSLSTLQSAIQKARS